MSVSNIRLIQVAPAQKPTGQKVCASRPIRDLIVSYMQVKERDCVKGVSQDFLASAQRVERKELLKYFPESGLCWVAGKKGLSRIKIRNFPTRVQAPLKNYPDFMAGWEQIKPGVFTLYLIRTEKKETSARSCIPGQVARQQKELSYFCGAEENRHVRISEIQTSCCSAMEDPGCCAALAFMLGCTWLLSIKGDDKR